MKGIERIKGTRDFSQSEMENRRAVERRMRTTCRYFGYREIGTPLLERTELFELKSGENITQQMYSFKDKGGKRISLRPELTAPAMRFYADKLQSQPKPLKLYYFGPCFRYEQPQAGRYRQFWHLGVECIGAGEEANAEIIALAVKCLQNSGLSKLELRIGDLNVLRAIAGSSGEVMRRIDKKDFASLRGIKNYDKLMRLVRAKEITEAQNLLLGKKKALEALEDLERMFDTLYWFGVKDYRLDLGIARGLDYYSGMVFEIDSPLLGTEREICGGGEYSLVELLGGEKISTRGFAIGFDRVMLALEKEGKVFEEEKPKCFVVPVSDYERKKALEIVTTLRDNGVRADVELAGRSLSKSLGFANAIGARWAVIIGKEDLRGEKVTLRDMDSGEQKKIPIKELLAHL